MGLKAVYILYWSVLGDGDTYYWRIYTFDSLPPLYSWINSTFSQTIEDAKNLMDWINYYSGGEVFLSNRDYDPIITNGLSLYVDSFHFNSYPKTSTTWYSLTGAGGGENDGVIYNTFDFVNSSIIFSYNGGLLTYVRFQTLSENVSKNSNTYVGVTVEVWLELTELFYTNQVIMECDDYKLYFNDNKELSLSVVGNRIYTTNEINCQDFVDFGGYHQICFTCHADSNVVFYLDGQQKDSMSFTGISANPVNEIFLGSNANIDNGIIGGIPILRIYNRVLTSTEIQENFDCTNTRFV